MTTRATPRINSAPPGGIGPAGPPGPVGPPGPPGPAVVRVLEGVIDISADYNILPADDAKVIRADATAGQIKVFLPDVFDPDPLIAGVPQWSILLTNFNGLNDVYLIGFGAQGINGFNVAHLPVGNISSIWVTRNGLGNWVVLGGFGVILFF